MSLKEIKLRKTLPKLIHEGKGVDDAINSKRISRASHIHTLFYSVLYSFMVAKYFSYDTFAFFYKQNKTTRTESQKNLKNSGYLNLIPSLKILKLEENLTACLTYYLFFS